MSYRMHGPRIAVLVILIFALAAVPGFARDKAPVEGAPGKVKDWSLGYGWIHLKTVSGNTFDFHSLTWNYYTRNRWRVPLVTCTSLYIPAAVKDGDDWYTTLGDYYKYYFGLEFMLGLELGGKIAGDWRWRLSPGWNVNAILMPGKTGYYPFQSLTTGPAVNFMVEKDWDRGLVYRFGLYASFQMFDIIHSADRLKNGITVQLLMGISLKDDILFGGGDA